MSPVTLPNGKPFKVADHINPMLTSGEVFTLLDRDSGQERAVMKRRMSSEGYAVTDPGTSDRVSFFWEDLYCRPDGSIFHFRVEASEGMQTVGRYESMGGGRPRDLYLSKPGWRWANKDDVIKAHLRAQKNDEDQQARKKASDPLYREEQLAANIGKAVAAAQAGAVKQRSAM
jgi:hypothetical protein